MRRLSDQFTMIGGLFLFVGLISLLNGLFHAAGSVWMTAAGGVETAGVYIKDENEQTCIRYEADGKIYLLDCFMGGKPGEQAAVRYLPENPATARVTDADKWSPYIGSGVAFAAVGAAFLYARIRRNLLLKDLLKNGVSVQAQIDEIESGSFPPSRRKCYRVQASMKHPGTGRCVKVSSGWFLDHPGKHLTDGTVSVLADPNDEDRYYVKLERGEMSGYRKIKVNSEYWGNRS
ncbi:MAG: hypothetical protein IJE08_04360 [Clostridia bacterium]|nr:hypothetical protein [Clostridia bacterium]